ncbi:hypothetical protein PG994_014030 [Apiospora phragmitis]|uniref:N-acetyltransferase domain-containing protein n=1 Tax=Apiospora phragmitis TaxID=2905665 RepID=A0ABR1T357_9PEZI
MFAQSGLSYRLPTPQNKTTSQEYKKDLLEALLGVVICLKPSAAADDDVTTASTATTTENEAAAEPGTTPANPPAPAPAPIPVGVVMLNANGDPAKATKWAQHRGCSLTIDILQAHWGNGYGGEAIEWALGFAFRMADLHRVTLNAFSYNERALRLYGRLGFVREARLREDVWFNGGWHDSVSFGMLEGEWRARQEGLERRWGE